MTVVDARDVGVHTLLAAHPLVAKVFVVQQDDRTVVMVVPRRQARIPDQVSRAVQLRDRVLRLAPQRVLQVGVGDPDLPEALAKHCAVYRLVEPLRAAEALKMDQYDLVLLDLAAPKLSTLDIPAAVLAALSRAGAVFVANLRDPRVERLESWTRTGEPRSTPDAAGWSPPALVRGLADVPGVEVHAYPPLGPVGDFDVVLRHAGEAAKVPMLRWNREVQSPAHLSRLLEERCVERVRLVGIPLAGVVDSVLAWRENAPRSAAIRYGFGVGVDWREVEAISADHGYDVTFVASLTGTEYHFDAVLERSGRPPRRPPDQLAPQLRRWLAERAPDIGPVDLAVLDDFGGVL